MITIAIISILIIYFIFFHNYGHKDFKYISSQLINDETKDIGKRITVNIPAIDGSIIEGWLYIPEVENCPIVVLAPGLTSTKECFLEIYAWSFVSKGIAALTIDFRTFGGSEGTPRHWVSPKRQVEDYLSTISFITNHLCKTNSINPNKIAIWGSSFSGGVAVKLAAVFPDKVKAVIAQVPYLKNSKETEPKGLTMLRFICLTLIDTIRSFVSEKTKIKLSPVYVTAFAKTNEFAFSKTDENPSRDHKKFKNIQSPFWKEVMRPLRGGWENKMLARVFIEMGEYEPMKFVDKITQPIYLISASDDKEILPEFIDEAYESINHKNKKITKIKGGHYDVYIGDIANKNAESQAIFLKNVFDNLQKNETNDISPNR
ncbi:MAG: alpha/beta fold hydrolase [Daejeonella sp.]